MMLGKLHNHMQKNEVEPVSYIIHKNQLKKCIKDLKVRPENIKIIEQT